MSLYLADKCCSALSTSPLLTCVRRIRVLSYGSGSFQSRLLVSLAIYVRRASHTSHDTHDVLKVNGYVSYSQINHRENSALSQWQQQRRQRRGGVRSGGGGTTAAIVIG